MKREKELARYHLAPIVCMVGPVPVVLVPILTLAVGVDGDVHISVAASVTQQASVIGGMQYSNGSWRPISQYANQFQYELPRVSSGGDLKGYAGPRFEVLLYGLIGGQIKLDGYVKLEADTAETPWWKLYGGLQLSSEFRMELLSRKIASHEIPVVIGVKVLLAQADTVILDVTGQWYWEQGPYWGNFYITQTGNTFSGTLDDVWEGTYGDKVINGVINGTSFSFTRDGRYGIQYWKGTVITNNGVMEISNGLWQKQGWASNYWLPFQAHFIKR